MRDTEQWDGPTVRQEIREAETPKLLEVHSMIEDEINRRLDNAE